MFKKLFSFLEDIKRNREQIVELSKMINEQNKTINELWEETHPPTMGGK